MKTELDQQTQTQDALTNAQAISPYSLNPQQGTVIPSFYAQDDIWREAAKSAQLVNPPSVEEIDKQMWIGSFMTALMVGLTTGDAGAAIAGGLWGAIAIHDGGYSLRKRAEHVPQLQKDGYSAQSILQWYETGDQKGLDAERDDMLARDKFNEQNRDDVRNFTERQRQYNENMDFREERQRQNNAYRNANLGLRREGMNQRERLANDRNSLARERMRLMSQNKMGINFDPTAPNARQVAQQIVAKATDTQRLNAGYARRMNSAMQEIDTTIDLIDPEMIGEIANAVGNGSIASLGLNDSQSRFANALEDMIRAILRKESGAVIGADERSATADQYFPMAGDGEAVTNRKIQTLQEYTDNMEASSGGIYDAFDYMASGGDQGKSLPANAPGAQRQQSEPVTSVTPERKAELDKQVAKYLTGGN